jgi:hypothetical protein
MDNGRVMDFEDFRSLFYFPQLDKPAPIPELTALVQQASKTSLTTDFKSSEASEEVPRRFVSRHKLVQLAKPRLPVVDEGSIGHA